MTNSGKPVKHKDRKKLFDKGGYFDQHEPAPDVGLCAMETVLSTILDGVVKKALAPSSRLDRLMSREVRGVSLYVFTDGVREGRRGRGGSDGEAGGVENAI